MADKELQNAAKTLTELLDKTNKEKPKPNDVKALRKFLAEHPEMWKAVGNLVLQAQYGIVESINTRAGLRESLKAGLGELPKELARPGDGPLEHLLIDQIVIAWLRQGIAEYYYTEQLENSFTYESGRYWERRLTQTQARYLKAVESLARVRKLSRPGAVQVNIGAQQTNIAQGAPSKNPAAPQDGIEMKLVGEPKEEESRG